VLLLGLSTYFVVALTLRSVAALRHGAADITAQGLSGQRLPVPTAQDEIQRLAVTLNAMLDRIEQATARQRTFVGDAAHELRSPLASLRVQLEVAQRMGANNDWPALIDDVLIDVDRLDRLVEDLLALARLDETGGKARREPVALGALVGSITMGYDHARVPVRIDDDSENVIVQGDQDGLHRVLVNLVDNAVRYARSEVTVCVSRNGRHAQLSVADDGPGLPEYERERVFDRFYRVETSRSRDLGGTGLGLPIVRDLVRAHDGTVELTAHGDGSPGLVAVVTLPLP
jgi:signal transduction histidine kinase